jgi:hypothetical protein
MAEPLRATFYLFRRHGERGGVLLGATVTTAIVGLALLALFVLMWWPLLATFFNLVQDGAAASSDQVGNVVGGMLGMVLLGFVWLFFFYVLCAAYEAACLRWMIRREAPGLFGLNLGADTWRVYSGYWLWFAISTGVSMAVSTVTTPLMFFVMAPVGEATDPMAMLGPMFGVQVVAIVLQYAAMIFVGVRFAPAAATSIARKRFAFFEAWKVTKGRFWALFGSFFILMFAYVLVSLVFAGLALAVFATRLYDFSAGEVPDFQALLTPGVIALFAVGYGLSIVTGLVFVILSFGVNARAVIAAMDEGKIEGHSPNVAEVFS